MAEPTDRLPTRRLFSFSVAQAADTCEAAMHMVFSTPDPHQSFVTMPAHVAEQVAAEEHVALLANPGKFHLLQRKDDLLDEGVAGVFGLAGENAELVALCFHVRKFTPAEVAKWLAERGIVPLLCVPNSA